jgi:hypothetical protein
MKYLIYLFFRLFVTSFSKVHTVHIQTKTFATVDEDEKLQDAKA